MRDVFFPRAYLATEEWHHSRWALFLICGVVGEVVSRISKSLKAGVYQSSGKSLTCESIFIARCNGFGGILGWRKWVKKRGEGYWITSCNEQLGFLILSVGGLELLQKRYILRKCYMGNREQRGKIHDPLLSMALPSGIVFMKIFSVLNFPKKCYTHQVS